MIPTSRSQEVILKALEYSQKASDAMWKHILIVLGIMLYISFVVLATVYHPSYYACMARGGTLWSLANAIVHAVFMLFLVFYVVRQFMDEVGSSGSSGTSGYSGVSSVLLDYVNEFDRLLPYILSFCVTYLLISYGILFFRCRDVSNCPGCTPTQATTFNTLITTQVNRTTPKLKVLLEFYTEYSKDRVSISQCINYSTPAYKTAGATCQSSDTNGTNDTNGPTYVQMSQDNVNPNVVDGAPHLNQFFVMTSGRTCVVSHQYDSYMSPAMIRIALMGGARCLDFEVTNHAYTQKSFPVVTQSRNRDNRNLQHNFVLFEDILRTIHNEWIEPHQSAEYPADPLFLRFVLDSALTESSMNQMAYLLQYYFNEQSGAYLLPNAMHYVTLQDMNSNIGNFPLALYYGRIVILVYSPCPPVTRTFKNSMLGELTNAFTETTPSTQMTHLVGNTHGTDSDSGFQVLDWMLVKQSIPKSATSGAGSKPPSDSGTTHFSALLEYNTNGLTYVETSFTPYSTVNTQPGTGCFDPTYPDRSGNGSDSVTTLLMNKVTINNSPLPSFRTGCQFIAMNFQDISEEMKTYLSVFEKASFILKPQSQWNTNDFGDLPPPNSSCSPGDTPWTAHDTTSNMCYEFCLAPGENPVNPTTYINTQQKSVPMAKLTSDNNPTQTCILPGYKTTPGGIDEATLPIRTSDNTTKHLPGFTYHHPPAT